MMRVTPEQGLPFFLLQTMGREDIIHAELCKWIAHKYPHVIFNSDMSGVRLHRGLQAKVARLRSHKYMPDLHIMEPKGHFHGMFLEIKAEGVRVYLKDGTITKNKHIFSQYLMLEHLYRKGYYATFGVGMEQCMERIDFYLKLTR